MNLLKVGQDESLHKRISRRGRVEQSVLTREKYRTKRTKGLEKNLIRNFLKVRKIKSRGKK